MYTDSPFVICVKERDTRSKLRTVPLKIPRTLTTRLLCAAFILKCISKRFNKDPPHLLNSSGLNYVRIKLCTILEVALALVIIHKLI